MYFKCFWYIFLYSHITCCLFNSQLPWDIEFFHNSVYFAGTNILIAQSNCEIIKHKLLLPEAKIVPFLLPIFHFSPFPPQLFTVMKYQSSRYFNYDQLLSKIYLLPTPSELYLTLPSEVRAIVAISLTSVGIQYLKEILKYSKIIY